MSQLQLSHVLCDFYSFQKDTIGPRKATTNLRRLLAEGYWMVKSTGRSSDKILRTQVLSRGPPLSHHTYSKEVAGPTHRMQVFYMESVTEHTDHVHWLIFQ